MGYKKTLLGVASLVALTAGMQEPANASPQRADQAAQPRATVRTVESEAFLDLLMRSQGRLSSDAIESAIVEAFSNPTPDQIQNAPELLRDFVALGLTAEGIQRLRDVLGEIVSSAENLDDALRTSVISELNSEVTPFVLAQARRRACTKAQLRNPKLRSQCDPKEVGQTRSPREVGQTGAPGVGGGYQ